jgi:putative FmdB family regulatory protein
VPLFDFQCKECDHTFEALVLNGEAVECPQCQDEHVERLLSLPAKPRSTGQSLPMSCDPKLPPCGPGCCRL